MLRALPALALSKNIFIRKKTITKIIRVQNSIVLQLAAGYTNDITAGRCRSAKYKQESECTLLSTLYLSATSSEINETNSSIIVGRLTSYRYKGKLDKRLLYKCI